MMEIIIRLEQNEVGRLFTTLGGGLMNLMQQRTRDDMDPVANIDAAGRIGAMGGGGRTRRPNEVRSVADVMDVMSRLQSDQGPLFPENEGECQHRYVYLHTERDSDIYVCQQDGCGKHLTIPGRIIQPAPIVEEEQQEVIEDEPEREPEGEPPGLPPGGAEEVERENPPS